MMSVLSAVLAMIFMLFFESILTMHLINDMKLSENTAGYFFGLICATYAISSPFVGCLTTFIARKWLTFSAFLIAFVALLMFGPSQVLNFPNEITLTAGGLALLGCSCSIIFVPLLSEIIDGVRTSEGVIHSGTINDKAAGVFNTAYAVGCIIAPILGGYLNMYTNFRITCDTMAFSSLTYGLIFFIVIILPSFCKRSTNNSSND
jgi:MFS family permease